MCRGFLLRRLTTRTSAEIGDTKRLHFQPHWRLICTMPIVIRSTIPSRTPAICSRVMQTKFAFLINRSNVLQSVLKGHTATGGVIAAKANE